MNFKNKVLLKHDKVANTAKVKILKILFGFWQESVISKHIEIILYEEDTVSSKELAIYLAIT